MNLDPTTFAPWLIANLAGNIGLAVVLTIGGIFAGRNPLVVFMLAAVGWWPVALAYVAVGFFFGKARTPPKIDPNVKLPAARQSLTRSHEAADRSGTRDLLKQMREAESARKRVESAAPEPRSRDAFGGSTSTGGAGASGGVVAGLLNRAREATGGSAGGTQPQGSRERREAESATRRAAEADRRAAERARMTERRRAPTKAPPAGLSPNDPNFLRGYRPKNNRIP